MIKSAINNPYAAFVGMAIAVMFGLISLFGIPVQLKPTIEPTEISIETYYWGASPIEVEDQITNKIEEEVAGINDLERVVSTTQEGVSQVRLVFVDSADKNKALIDTLQAMKRVTELPELATEPEIKLVTGGQGEEIMWITLEGEASLDEKHDMVDELIQPRLLRVNGVGEVQFFGGVERKIVVEPVPDMLVQHGISLNQLAGVISADNINARGGYIDEGDRQFMVRTLSKYESLADVRDTVIMHGPTGTITVGDVAKVIDGRDRRLGYVHNDGIPTVVMGVSRQSGANVVSTIRSLQEEIAVLNRQLTDSNQQMQLEIVYSELHYVQDAISLVRNNLLLGALLAAIVLALFLKAARPIFIVIVTIPVALITVFIVLALLGRTINIISLAGIAFCVGIVVDNAIVVIENIERHMVQLGKKPFRAAYDGVTEISGALVASTLTTVAVFIPIVLNTTEAGLLFKDIAIAIVSAVLMSLASATLLVPAMSAVFMRPGSLRKRIRENNPALHRTLSLFELHYLGVWVTRGYDRFLNYICTRLSTGKTFVRLGFLALVLIVFIGSLQLLPSANYLPNGTREFIFCAAKPVVGQRNDVSIEAIKPVEEFAAQDDRIAGYFAVSAQPFFTGMGVMVKRELSTEKNLQELVEKIGEIGFMLPGFQFFFPMRSSIFNIPDKEFTIEITGEDLTQLKATADQLLMQLFALEEYVVQARTEYSEGVPELGVHVDRYQAAQLGLTSREIAAAIEMMVGGRDVSTYTESGREYDLMVRSSNEIINNRRDLREAMLQTPTGDQVRLSELASIDEGIGPSTIRHYNRQRSIQLTVNTNPALSTQEALDAVDEQIVKPAQEGLAADSSIRFGEAADKLRTTINSLIFQGAFAVFIVYLLMVSLFRSFRYPLVILVTIPLAWSGSFVALALAYKLSDGIIQFDILGMLGLIILTGIVVNNAILIIHQMQNNEAEGMSPLEALKESARTRLRPITMSVLTSAFGMLPLALGQGSGSELYRGLGLVVVGGLLVSTLFTLFVVPTILSMIQQYMEQRNIKEFGKAAVDRHRTVDKD